MPKRKRTPNPFPMSDHQAEAAGIRFAAKLHGHRRGCICVGCEQTRRTYVSGWQACRGRAGKAKRDTNQKGV